MIPEDEKPIPLPEKFRASSDPTDEPAFQRLLENDEVQKQLGEKINAPFTRNTPLERAMAIAFNTIKNFHTVPPQNAHQIEQLADAYATVGEYETAAKLAPDKGYRDIWDAVWRPDDELCVHPPKHWFVSQRIFSVKEGRELPLMKCNICHLQNCLDGGDDHLKAQQATQAAHQGKTQGMSISAAKTYHAGNY